MNKKRVFLIALSVMALFFGSLLLLTWRATEGPRRQALFDAIRTDNAPRTLALLRAGADPNTRLPDLRRTPPTGLSGLFPSTRHNTVAPTPLLAAVCIVEHPDHPANISESIRYNPHPDPVIIRALLEAGADANGTDYYMNMPLHFAVSSGSIEVVGLLLKHGANVNPQGKPLLASGGRVEIMRYLLEQGADINAVDFFGSTALISTIRFGSQADPVKLLLDHHISVNARDRQGKTALFYAQHPAPYRPAEQNKHLPEIIELLKKAGAQ